MRRYDSKEYSCGATNLKLLYITMSKYDNDWCSIMHSHQCIELFYVVSGYGEFRVEELRLPVSANDAVVINPNVEHTEIGLPQLPLEYIVLGVEGGELLLSDNEDSRYCAFNCGQIGKDVLFYLRAMLDEMRLCGEYHQSVTHNLLEVLFLILIRHKSASLVLRPTPKQQRECIHVKRYIDDHFKEKITLEQLAKLVHLNKFHLAHIFRKEYGVSPISYLNVKRIEESRFLLSDTNHSVSQIANVLGFSSPNYFSQCFAKMAGMSPTKYRMKLPASQKMS
ncbi:MAG: AraC family transcriptional regulator [Clostridiales bacterium]|nr:AraC family transcriptional regulator [Clostridiales bacterium]